MKILKLTGVMLILAEVILTSACNKDWLNAKPNKALVVPSTVADYQALLDDQKDGQAPMNINLPGISMVGDGDYYVTDATYNGLGNPPESSAYIWAPTAQFYGGQTSGDWINAYARVLKNNVVLDGLSSLNTNASTQAAYNNVKGSALFYRSLDFFDLSQEFCKVYDAATASTDMGLPLRLSSNVNVTVGRASLEQTYDQLINDLLKAAPMLPATPLFPTRPSKPAVFGLLARVYLSQENYDRALLYADSCLQLQHGLMDFNQLSLTARSPIPYFNGEVIFHAQLAPYTSDTPAGLIVDSLLYRSYNSNDLRASIFFTVRSGNVTTKSSYAGSSYVPFGGLATDEMYLTRAECYARAGKTTEAMNDLNTLLQNRFITGTYTPAKPASADAALALVLTERRKELCFRNLRWSDLRRLNKDPRFQTTLTRVVDGQNYTLGPNSPRYVLPLDPIETSLGGLPQNPR